MGAVRREHLELISLNPSDPAGQSRGMSVGLAMVRIFEHRHARRPSGNLETGPRENQTSRSAFDQAGKNISHDRYPDHEGRNRVNNDSDLQQKVAPCRITSPPLDLLEDDFQVRLGSLLVGG